MHIHTHIHIPVQPKRMLLCSPLCVSPPAWQMHLLSKSWWIFSLNSKSKPHFPSPSLLWKPFMSAMPPASPSNHSLTKRQWKKTLLWILIFTAWWACVMNGSNIHSCICTPHIRWVRNMLSFLPLSSSWLTFDKLCCDPFFYIFLFFAVSVLFSKVPLISLTPHSPLSGSAALFHFFVLSTASLPEWQLTEVGIILNLFHLAMNIQCKQRSFMHGCQISCVLIRGIVSLICWLTE